MVRNSKCSVLRPGFTIVELLVVIVVIGILASITIVSYSGIQNNANDTAIKNDLRNFSTAMDLYRAEFGAYPSVLTTSMGLKFSKGSYGLDAQSYNVRYCYNSSTDVYIMYASSKSGRYYRYTPNGGIEPAAVTYGWGVCDQIGLVTTNPTQNGLTTTTWASWVN